jgi:hypothetical protein
MEQSANGAIFEGVTVTKIDAAERQLCEAIRLFFEKRDPIAVHTLTAAAQDVCRRLGKPRGFKGFYDEVDNSFCSKQHRKDFSDRIRKAQNFFKHADKSDPDEKLEFYHELARFLMLDAVVLCSSLRGHFTPEMLIFLAWMLLNYPKFFEVDNPRLNEAIETAKNLGSGDFDTALRCIDILKATHGGRSSLLGLNQ